MSIFWIKLENKLSRCFFNFFNKCNYFIFKGFRIFIYRATGSFTSQSGNHFEYRLHHLSLINRFSFSDIIYNISKGFQGFLLFIFQFFRSNFFSNLNALLFCFFDIRIGIFLWHIRCFFTDSGFI